MRQVLENDKAVRGAGAANLALMQTAAGPSASIAKQSGVGERLRGGQRVSRPSKGAAAYHLRSTRDALGLSVWTTANDGLTPRYVCKRWLAGLSRVSVVINSVDASDPSLIRHHFVASTDNQLGLLLDLEFRDPPVPSDQACQFDPCVRNPSTGKL